MMFYIACLLIIFLALVLVKYAEWKSKAIDLEDAIFLADFDNHFIEDLEEIGTINQDYKSILQNANSNANKRIKAEKSLELLIEIESIKEIKAKRILTKQSS